MTATVAVSCWNELQALARYLKIDKNKKNNATENLYTQHSPSWCIIIFPLFFSPIMATQGDGWENDRLFYMKATPKR